MESIATTQYSAEGLRPPSDTPAPTAPPTGEAAPSPGPAVTPPVARYQRRAHWIRRGDKDGPRR
ncbi:hypothetical protein [Streptomyces sp. NBC_00057]|uniref:hypothetical protein n=1 Tax=Streptomyces sp. NBC_00057 TaxID=2975634 RepID=UPI003253E581